MHPGSLARSKSKSRRWARRKARRGRILVGLARMKTGQQLLVSPEDLSLVAQEIAARKQRAGPGGEHVGGDGEEEGAVGHHLHGVEAGIKVGRGRGKGGEQLLVALDDFSAVGKQIAMVQRAKRLTESIPDYRKENFPARADVHRSEEHTSELQSHSFISY